MDKVLHFIAGLIICIPFIGKIRFPGLVILCLFVAVSKEVWDFLVKDPSLIDSLFDIGCTVLPAFIVGWITVDNT